MARPGKVVWSAPALDDLDEIAAWIARDDAVAASRLVGRAIAAVDRLRDFPSSGKTVRELPGGRYREVIVPPCRIIYRNEGNASFIVHVLRGERQLKPGRLRRRG